MTYSMIQVGIGDQGAHWCSDYLPPNVENGLVDVVAAVDVDEGTHSIAKDHLGLSDAECYMNVERAFEDHDADVCTVVIPPQVHEDVVDVAIDHDAHVLSEKPIADTLDASVRIAEKVERAGLKMGVTMSHRFDRDKTTLRRELRSGEHGPLDYLVHRFTCNCRSHGSWSGDWKYAMDDPLLISGAIHHLDILADLVDAKCDTVWAQTWNPPWSDFAGDCQALVNLSFENGCHAVYEGAKANAVGLNGWGSDYIRAECRDSTLVLDDREITQFPYDPDARDRGIGGLDRRGQPVEMVDLDTWANTWLVEQFVEWLDGGDPMATNVRDNLQSMALVFAAIESSETGRPVRVQELLEAAQERVEN